MKPCSRAALLVPLGVERVDLRLDLGDASLVAVLHRDVELVALGVDDRLGGSRIGVGGVDLLVEPGPLVLEGLDLGPLALQRRLLLGDLRVERLDLGLVESGALLLGLTLELLRLELAELRLEALPGLGVVLEDHPQGDREERQGAPCEPHVHLAEVVVAIRCLLGCLCHAREPARC